MLKSVLIALMLVCVSQAAFASSIELISLLDIQGQGNPELLIGATDEQKAQYLPDGKLPSQILEFYVKVSGRGILFDTGLGDGHIVNELANNGIEANDIDTILITHLHPDHFGGLLTPEGKKAFPNAKVYVGRIERDYWVNTLKNENVINALKPYDVREFEFDDELFGSVKAIEATGHTPGHTVFEVNADDEKLLIVGDIVHFIQIQFPLPEISVRYDTDPDKARESRIKILDYAATNQIPIAGMHITLPGTCKVEKVGTGFAKR